MVHQLKAWLIQVKKKRYRLRSYILVWLFRSYLYYAEELPNLWLSYRTISFDKYWFSIFVYVHFLECSTFDCQNVILNCYIRHIYFSRICICCCCCCFGVRTVAKYNLLINWAWFSDWLVKRRISCDAGERIYVDKKGGWTTWRPIKRNIHFHFLFPFFFLRTIERNI